MKRRIVLIPLVLSLAFACVSCSRLSPQKKVELEDMMHRAVLLLDAEDERYVSSLMLHGGGYLIVYDNSLTWPEEKDFDYNIITIEDGEIVAKEYLFYEDYVPIFYDQEGAYSVFIEYDGYAGTDYLVYVAPNMNYGRSFKTTPDRDYVPYDTLKTKPLFIQDENYQKNCPVWIFDLDRSTITENYELHYGDFVLTGKDLLSFSWNPPSD